MNAYKYKIIKETIQDNKLKVSDIAKKAGYARTYISSILSGKYSYNTELLNLLLGAVNINYKEVEMGLQIYEDALKIYDASLEYLDLQYASRAISNAKKTLESFPVMGELTQHLDEILVIHLEIVNNNVSINSLLPYIFEDYNITEFSSEYIINIELFYKIFNSTSIYKEVALLLIVEHMLINNEHKKTQDLINVLIQHYLELVSMNGMFLIGIIQERLKLRMQSSFTKKPLKDIKEILNFKLQVNPFFEVRYDTLFVEECLITKEYLKKIPVQNDSYLCLYNLIMNYYHYKDVEKFNLLYLEYQYLENVDMIYLHKIINGQDLERIMNKILLDTTLDIFITQILVVFATDYYEDKRQYKQANLLLKRLIHKVE